MKYDVISADGHIDLIWLPPDLFSSNASGQMKDRMPFVTEGENGPKWVSKGGRRWRERISDGCPRWDGSNFGQVPTG